MRWIPPWLAKAYARIYEEKKTEVFDFSEAARILEIEDERRLANRLTMLKSSGHLTVRRDPVDPRRKLFRLIDPENVTRALAVQSRVETDDILEKLRAASGLLDYYVDGAYAAYQYHRYSAAGSMDISVRKEQLPTWIALLSEKDVAISVDEVPSEKPLAVNIHLHSDFGDKLAERTKIINGVMYLSPEALAVTGFVPEVGESGEDDRIARTSLEDILAILVVQRMKLDWNKLLALSDSYSTTRYLACILDILNFESGKPLFKPTVINKMLRKYNIRVKLDFPSKRRLKAETAAERYPAFFSKWNVRLRVSYAVVSKIITDLVRTRTRT